MVTKEYPEGAYLRSSIDGYTREVSPIRDISTTMYCQLITIVTSE